ncbi:hypothetical protein [Pseudomonas koreensis]|uniref:Uncharacterized protein n=1 Tax=Pseudomonas koreensis TaxID=198620 RepID=A0AA94EM80_9PSED|nr:hypothetical protein [Pseudomonas koreensis]RVD76821.1 hypothetical protein A9HBioS_3361 [Pseudomonas koreensis]
MSELKVIYLGPACQEQGQSSGREWCQDDVWDACECGHESVRYVLASEFDRVTAEHDALQQRLNAADQRNDELSGMLQHLVDNPYRFTDAYRERIAAVLNPSSKTPDHFRDAAKMIGIERMPPMEYDEP